MQTSEKQTDENFSPECLHVQVIIYCLMCVGLERERTCSPSLPIAYFVSPEL